MIRRITCRQHFIKDCFCVLYLICAHRQLTRISAVKRPEIGYNEHMADLKKNIFLTGAPSSGKTTVIKKVIACLRCPATGFYTEEERVAGKRVGFVMETLKGKSGYLAHQDIQSDFYIRRYGVSIENIETIAVPSITPRNRHIIILDEIGKMECFSDVFKQAALTALDSPNIVVGTIALGSDDFITRIKSRGDIEIHEVTQENRDSLPDLILERVARLLKQ
jgi:nucleoside-triphosphatase